MDFRLLFNLLVYTSADDCKKTLRSICHDVDALREVLAEMDRCELEFKTKRQHIERRIRLLEKERKNEGVHASGS